MLYHNTVVKAGDAFNVITDDPISRATSRNNIFIGGPAGTFNEFTNGAGRVMYLPSADATNDFNYDGFGSIGTGNFTGRIGSTTFDSLIQLQSQTTEQNSVQLNLSVFTDDVVVPSNPVGVNAPPSFELAVGSPAIDVGIPLAGFNDGFTGSAPDLGAYEQGRAIPVYGVGGNIGTPDLPTLLGDCNLDGVVNFADISPFISILSANDYLEQADVNQDGTVDFADISPFISLLSSN